MRACQNIERSGRSTFGVVGSAVALAVAALANPLAGQVPTASAAWMGTGQNYVAAVRGFGAIGLNPARMAMPGNPGWSLSIPAAQAGFGLDPIGLADLADYSGETLPDDVREEWLERIIENGGQRGLATVAATGLSGTWGRYGIQVSSTGIFRGDTNEDAAELILFGNSGRTGDPRSFVPSSSQLDGFWVSSVALSGAFPTGIRIGSAEEQHFSFGANLKLHFGHTALVAREAAGSLQPEPVTGEANFPLMQTRETKLDNGFGVGVDIAAAWEAGRWSAGLMLENLFNTFEWDFSNLDYRQGEAFFDVGAARSSFETRDAGEAPGSLQDAVNDAGFDPTLTLGGAYDVRTDLKVLADFTQRFGDGLSLSPKTRVGAGAEWGVLNWLILRGGGSVITDGYRIGGGAGFVIGPVNLAGAYLTQGGDIENADIFAITLSLHAQ
jgi:hypothetical protein